jgi:hypothetical protein
MIRMMTRKSMIGAGIAAALIAAGLAGYALFPRESCRIGSPGTCPDSEICALVSGARAGCIARDQGPIPVVRLPSDPTLGAVCTVGPQKGEHLAEGNLFALDLETRAPTNAPARVWAATDGTAIVNLITKEGATLGNHVRILDPRQGIMVLYAHLSRVDVQDGQAVRIGDLIGTEGRSGTAGRKHLHFSVHRFEKASWPETLDYYRKTPGPIGASIPFEAVYCDVGVKDECLRKRTRVEHLACDGTSVLRGDDRPN